MNKTELQNKVNELEAQLAEARTALENWKSEGKLQIVKPGGAYYIVVRASTYEVEERRNFTPINFWLCPLTEDLTREGAELKRDALQLRLDIMQALDEHVPDWHVLDWENANQKKYHIEYISPTDSDPFVYKAYLVASLSIKETIGQLVGNMAMTKEAAEYVLKHFDDRIKDLYKRGGSL